MYDKTRLRVFAGPNGSGKTTLFKAFTKRYDPGYFINADEYEQQLTKGGLIDLTTIGLKATQADLDNFSLTAEAKSLVEKAKSEGGSIDIEIRENFIVDRTKQSHSYEASYAAAFVRSLLFRNNRSFSIETVMSHESKLEAIRFANTLGYRTYLYFVCTENPDINIGRVANRVFKGGHPVEESRVRDRFSRTLKLLIPAIGLVYRAYIFDNSGKQQIKLVAEVFEGNLKTKVGTLPQWFRDYLLPHYTI